MNIDNVKIKMEGHITISDKDGNVLFSDNNAILPDAKIILMRCLTQRDFEKSLDFIKVYGTFGEAQSEISYAKYLGSEGAILLRAIFNEDSFNGTISSMKLYSSAINKFFSEKTNMFVNKTNQAMLQIDWKITLTIQ
jgi:hypothetical protein